MTEFLYRLVEDRAVQQSIINSNNDWGVSLPDPWDAYDPDFDHSNIEIDESNATYTITNTGEEALRRAFEIVWPNVREELPF
jgi:hypothetical protein